MLPVTSQHIAVGQHCVDMLLRKDKISLKAQPTTTKKGPGKGKADATTSHLATDNMLQHFCKLKYPSINTGTPKDAADQQQRPLKSASRKESIGIKSNR